MARKRTAQFTNEQTQEALAQHGAEAAWNVFLAGNDDHFEERVIVDLVGKLRFWGSLSDKQWTFLGNLITQIADRPAKEAAEAAKRAAAQPIPVNGERVTITGTVLCLKYKFDRFYGGDVLKILVEDERGFKVWGTRPACLRDAEKGDTVRFDAKVTRAAGDDKFGFFSRPTKGDVTKAAA